MARKRYGNYRRRTRYSRNSGTYSRRPRYQRRHREPGFHQLGSYAARRAGRTTVNVTGGLVGGVSYVLGRLVGGFTRGLTRR